MLLTDILWLLITAVISISLVVIVHESGHALVALLTGGVVEKVEFGSGARMIKVGKIRIGWSLFIGKGRCCWDNSKHHTLTYVEKGWICLGGVLANLTVFSILCAFQVNVVDGINRFIQTDRFMFLEIYSIMLILDMINLLPLKGSDGVQFLSFFFTKQSKN